MLFSITSFVISNVLFRKGKKFDDKIVKKCDVRQRAFIELIRKLMKWKMSQKKFQIDTIFKMAYEPLGYVCRFFKKHNKKSSARRQIFGIQWWFWRSLLKVLKKMTFLFKSQYLYVMEITDWTRLDEIHHDV